MASIIMPRFLGHLLSLTARPDMQQASAADFARVSLTHAVALELDEASFLDARARAAFAFLLFLRRDIWLLPLRRADET